MRVVPANSTQAMLTAATSPFLFRFINTPPSFAGRNIDELDASPAGVYPFWAGVIQPGVRAADGRVAAKPQPSTLNPMPRPLNPQPSTLNPQPSTLNTES